MPIMPHMYIMPGLTFQIELAIAHVTEEVSHRRQTDLFNNDFGNVENVGKASGMLRFLDRWW